MEDVVDTAGGDADTPEIAQLRDVESVSDAALAHLTLDDLLEALLVRIEVILAADTVAILLLDTDANELVARAAKGIEEEVEQGVRIPVGAGFAGRIVSERAPRFIPDVEHADVLNPLLRERGIKSLLGVPLIVAGEPIGVLHVGSLTPREFDDADAPPLQLVGARVAPAIAPARLFEAEREARRAAEAATERISRLQSITDVALAHLAFDDDLLNEMLVRVRDNMGVDT